MTIKLFSITFIFLLFFSFQNISYASNNSTDRYITINGSAQFNSSLIAKYMEKHGYVHLGEFEVMNHVKNNIFTATDAEVIVKNKFNNVIGTAIADKKGDFSVTVPRDNIYKVIVRFHGREIERLVGADTENITMYFGYIESQTIDRWFEEVALSYCYTCNIRHIEKNGYR